MVCMKKSMKYGIITVIFLLSMVRIYYVNKNSDLSIDKVYKVGEKVPYERDFTDSESTIKEGYTIKILDSSVYSREELYKKYRLTEEEEVSSNLKSHYYVIKVEVANESNKDKEKAGFSINECFLKGVNYYVMVDDILFYRMNKNKLDSSFSLREKTSMEVFLPFELGEFSNATYDIVKKNPPSLQITEYPTRKLLSLPNS